MEALSNVLKVTLYRVIFVLIVGIPALEFFSYAIFDCGIVFNIVDSTELANSTINAKLNLRLNRINLKSTSSIPGSLYVSPKSIKEADIYMENAGIRIDGDPVFKIEDPYVLKFTLGNKNKFVFFRSLPTIGWVIYLFLAFIVGETLCFIGELCIGSVFFKWKPFSADKKLESVVPFKEEYLKISDITKADSLIFEISEIHYVISRIFSGLSILSLLLAIKVNLILIFIFSFILIAIVYRSHANRLLFSGKNEERQSESNSQNS